MNTTDQPTSRTSCSSFPFSSLLVLSFKARTPIPYIFSLPVTLLVFTAKNFLILKSFVIGEPTTITLPENF
jgi:hypothetical protein